MNAYENKMIIDIYALYRQREAAGAVGTPVTLPSNDQVAQIEQCIRESTAKMSPLERCVLQGRIDGLTTEQLAQQTGYTPGYICQVGNVAIKKIDFSKAMKGGH